MCLSLTQPAVRSHLLMVFDLNLYVRIHGLLPILVLFHLFVRFYMRLRLLHEGPAVDVLGPHVVFGSVVDLLFVVEYILYLFA